VNPHLIVIGGGAAGIFCAVNAARLNNTLKVTVLEKSSKLLSKVKISGGGRCNVTNHISDPDHFSSMYPRGSRFVRKAFYQFFASDTIEWFESRGVKLHAEKDGRMFPTTNNSQTIIDCLMKETNIYGIQFMMNCSVKQITKSERGWELCLSDDSRLQADAVCVASGGGNKAEHFQMIQSSEHSIHLPVPSLFTFNLPNHPITELMGLSVSNVTVKIQSENLKESGPLLITHWGLSGPAVLRLSAWGARLLAEKNYRFTIIVNWLNQEKEEQVRLQFHHLRDQCGAKKISASCPYEIPQRLWDFLLSLSEIEHTCRWADLSQKKQNHLIRLLISHEFKVEGKSTFKEEFVTAGGVDLKEIHAATMESKLHEGLYFAGEVMDVDGITGGFNFQHAWTSGFVAASAVAKRFM
jgi:predicted Rossmann fold flavoprotein